MATNDEPRRSATLLLVRDDPFEVLLVRRGSSGNFASALVFPGGAVDESDASPEWAHHVDDFDDFDAEDRVLRIAAIRETWEETSILVGGTPAALPPGVSAADAPHGETFLEFVRQSAVRLQLHSLVPFGHWVTPVVLSRRFDTLFYLARAPDGQRAVADGGETVGIEWVSPAEAVGATRRREWPIIFPTLMNLERLAESTDTDAALAAASERPVFTVLPVLEVEPDGSTVITIPAEAGHSVTRFTP